MQRYYVLSLLLHTLKKPACDSAKYFYQILIINDTQFSVTFLLILDIFQHD